MMVVSDDVSWLGMRRRFSALGTWWVAACQLGVSWSFAVVTNAEAAFLQYVLAS